MMPQMTFTADRALNGSLEGEALDTAMMNFREFLFTDSNGELSFQYHIAVGLGLEKAAKIEHLYNSYVLAPEGNKSATVRDVANELRSPMSDPDFEKQTGVDSPEDLIAESDLPLSLHNQYIPIARAMARRFGTDTLSQINNYAKTKFTPYANGYSPHTASSMLEVNFQEETNINAFENGIAAKVDALNEMRAKGGLTPLYFIKGSKTSIDDIRGATVDDGGVSLLSAARDLAITGAQSVVQTGQAAVQALATGETVAGIIDYQTRSRTGMRVLVGPALDFSRDNPMIQLYAIDAMGNAMPVGGQFHMHKDSDMRMERNTIEVQSTLGAPSFGLTAISAPITRTDRTGRVPVTETESVQFEADVSQDPQVPRGSN